MVAVETTGFGYNALPLALGHLFVEDAMTKVLVVDDNPAVRTALGVLFEVHGIASAAAESPKEALETIAHDDIGVVIQDMNFTRDTTSGEEGVELFEQIRKQDPGLPVLLLTAWTSLETAVKLIKQGAADYLAKPWDDQKLVNSVRNLLKMRALHLENARLRQEREQARHDLAARFDLRGIVYASDSMHQLISLAVNIARADVPAFISGPNGSGKEVIADLIQANSPRKDKPFVKVNTGGLPDELMESELFGSEAGAYTGANKMRIGRFEAANGGTLFLDEIGNLSSTGQMKLLRVLQNGEFERLGSNVTQRVDVRLLSATNANLEEAIAKGTFREDLYYRLNVIELCVPPLSARADDILILAEHCLQTAVENTEASPTLGDGARAALLRHAWPGNVRELRNRIQRAILVNTIGSLTAADLGLDGHNTGAALTPQVTVSEKERVEEALRENGGVIARAAERLGMSRQALYRKMEKLGIVMERRLRK